MYNTDQGNMCLYRYVSLSYILLGEDVDISHKNTVCTDRNNFTYKQFKGKKDFSPLFFITLVLAIS